MRKLTFEATAASVCKYWKKRLERGMILEIPDRELMDFYRAHLRHVAITTDHDPETGLYNQGVATVRYRVFANETVMIARTMDMRGEHREAERFIEPMLVYQGQEPLTGGFSTKKGVFHSAGRYTHGKYAMNHGFVLWGAADHYLLTGDTAYLKRVAPKLIKGYDFLIKERRSHKGGLLTAGLAPPSSLEDVIEFQYCYATNAYFHLGMKCTAEAFTEADLPEADRIKAEARSYGEAIERSAPAPADPESQAGHLRRPYS